MRVRVKPYGFLFFAWGAAVVVVFVLLGASLIRSASPTFDEPAHLASGYTCLVKPGARCLDYRGHPPFGEKWAALPLLALHPKTFFDHRDWIDGRLFNYADLFLYGNLISAERLLGVARSWCLVTWSVALAFGILEWSLRLGGVPGMLGGGILFAFCPALLSNAALVTTDVCSAALFFLTFWLLSMRPRTTKRWMLIGAAAGLGLASKFNMVVIPAFAAAALAAERLVAGDRSSARPRDLALAAVCASAALAAPYRFYGIRDYWVGLGEAFHLVEEGRASFFFGDVSVQGHPLFFPAAFAIKTPIPLLVAAVVGLGALLRGSRARAEALWLCLPPAAYFLAASCARSQLGYRHILPIYPFVVVAGAAGTAWAWRRSAPWRLAAAALGLWCVLGVLRVGPDYLAYFNELVGGPSRGYLCLADSNLDWGQGLKELAGELRRRGNPRIVLSYFGNGDPSYYGIRYVPLAVLSMVDRLRGSGSLSRAPGTEADATGSRPSDVPEIAGGEDSSAGSLNPVLIAVSATNLQGVFFRDRRIFEWLKTRRPAFVAGYSIFLYDLTGDRDGIRRLAALLARDGRAGPARRLLSGGP